MVKKGIHHSITDTQTHIGLEPVVWFLVLKEDTETNNVHVPDNVDELGEEVNEADKNTEQGNG